MSVRAAGSGNRRIANIFCAVAAAGIVAAAILYRAELSAPAARAIAVFRDCGPLPFFVAMAILPAIGFPMAPFFMATGIFFAPRIGAGNAIACSVLAVAANVALSYGIAAFTLRPFVVRVVAWLGYAIPAIRPETAWGVCFLFRVVPGLPFFLQGCLLGLARAPFAPYMAVSTLVPSVYMVGVVLFGNGLATGSHRAIAAGAVLVVLISVAAHRVRRQLAG